MFVVFLERAINIYSSIGRVTVYTQINIKMKYIFYLLQVSDQVWISIADQVQYVHIS